MEASAGLNAGGASSSRARSTARASAVDSPAQQLPAASSTGAVSVAAGLPISAAFVSAGLPTFEIPASITELAGWLSN